MIKVLFVCLGNICRSPAAEGILRHLIKEHHLTDKISVRSCGLGSWHVGRSPDSRMLEAAAKRGLLLTSKGQQFTLDFFDEFDYILAADFEVLRHLKAHVRNSEQAKKLYLITQFSQSFNGKDIPDPYYGQDQGFEHVLDMLEESCNGLLQHLLSSLHI